MKRSNRLDSTDTILTWLHIGDLHMISAAEENYQHLRRIVELAQGLPQGSIDFIVLPGDNADDGTAEQFELVREAISPLGHLIHAVPGDHDFHSRSLQSFYGILQPRRLPYSITVKGRRCLFIDVVSSGQGGLDFRLDPDQLDWIERDVTAGGSAGQTVAIFMHTYPADLHEGAERLQSILRRPEVLCVDMGHTHYNELANDGDTIFMATRSTGQIEEGPVGFSICALDGNNVSWRFKSLDLAWPFVLITAPVDRRLATAVSYQLAEEPSLIRAKVLSDAAIQVVEASIDDGPWQPMHAVSAAHDIWELMASHASSHVRVRARDITGRQDEEAIELSNLTQGIPVRIANGSDADRLDAWPEKGLLGTQLGPNRNGRKW